MSINVTVSGNPIYIKKGTMVTSAGDASKEEFERRRLMRLEQVRHQSKNIAETVRNKVKKQKSKQLSDVEKEGEIRLKSWQARKLLDLQNQYQEALDEIGIGHKQADEVTKEEEVIVEKRESDDLLAKERGRIAAERLQVEKNQDSLKKATPIQQKKLSRDIENTRSHIVASLNKSAQKKRKRQVPDRSFDSDSENQVPNVTNREEFVLPSFEFSELEDPIEFVSSKRESVPKLTKEQQTSTRFTEVPREDKEAQTLVQEPVRLESCPKEVPKDTRISERIKRRSIFKSQPDYCDVIEKELQARNIRFENKQQIGKCKCCQCPERHYLLCKEKEIQTDELPANLGKTDTNEPIGQLSETTSRPLAEDLHHPTREDLLGSRLEDDDSRRSNVPEDLGKGPKFKTPGKYRRVLQRRGKSKSPVVAKSTLTSKSKDQTVGLREVSIPSKPKVTLRSAKEGNDFGNIYNKKVQYYDHPNRFSKEYYPNFGQSEKIDDENLIVSPNLSEDGILEKMRQRDLEAQIRGKVALEREKMSRDYRELLQKLPILQKQERIAEIGLDKEKYHMSKSRLDELERKKQNRLDNAYEELFLRRPPKVTLTSKYTEKETPPSNLSKWDTDFEPSREVCDKSRNEQLRDLLNTLKKQKKQLMKEIENSLPPETLSEFASLLKKSSSDEVKSKSTHYSEVKNGQKRKRLRPDRVLSPSSSEESTQSNIKAPPTSLKDQSSQTKVIPSPRKKLKVKSKKRLILQNISTQTTPKTESVATSPIAETAVDVSCKCKPVDDVCEIVIKIKEDNEPEVIVNPTNMQNSVKVVTEDKTKTIEDTDKIPQPTVKEQPKNKTSWREHFNNSSSISTTSTSYFDPPNFVKITNLKSKQKFPPKKSTTRSLEASVSSKDGKSIDPRLLTYIKKLLEKSHASIDDLTVSSASSVSTPSQSVVETPSNNPLMQLKNIMKYFKLNPEDVEKHLKEMSSGGDVNMSTPYNTSVSVTSSTNTTSDGEKTVRFKSCVEFEKPKEDQLTNITSTTEYEDIAISCNKKISDLTAMIEKVREEKKKILQITPVVSENSDQETSTSYLNLPPTKPVDDKDSTSSSSVSEDLLNIDYGYAEKLKRLTPEQMDSEKKKLGSDEQLLERLKTLLHVENDELDSSKLKNGEHQDQDFAPLLDIPKLPKLQTSCVAIKQKPRPPPSKGLRNLNANAPVPVIPHELSTIVEADSQLSNKFESPTKEVPDILTEMSRVASKSSSSEDKSEIETMESMLKSIGMEWAIPTLKKTREALALSSTSSSSSSKKDTSSLTLREFLSRISTSSSGKSLESPGSLLSETQEISLMQVDMRRTSTPVQGYTKDNDKSGKGNFITDSDISSVREQSASSRDRFYDLNDKSDPREQSQRSELRFRDVNEESMSRTLERDATH